MSQILINQYLAQLDLLKKVSGTERETVVREAFKDLLKNWGKQHDLIFIPEYKLESPTKDTRFVDGALLYELRVPFGYWEAKDANDNLDAEIDYKFKRGYPQDNIIFEDSTQAVLIQHQQEIMRCPVADVAQLEKLLKLFFAYERAEIADFRRAIEQFKIDLPAVLTTLRAMIDQAHTTNPTFNSAATALLKHTQKTINPSLTAADVREMLIQHILTEEIFSKIFDDSDFHRHNNVASELYRLEATFFTGGLKKATLKGLEPYYVAIRIAAVQIGNHSEKQTFLKVIYENFYKVYNAKAADRLGVVYTPNEIVRFMIEATDWLCEQHFNRNLIDPNVEILDPATGTGTFICELLEHFRGQPKKLAHKYREELHANEVAILPYYVANLNIEATYAAITGDYVEFPNLCFVDTLDKIGLHTGAYGNTPDFIGGISAENTARIKRQNTKKISVIIGNPPYNANQLNENDNNKNREYPDVDARIKQTYIAASTAQKTKLYDMYARFFRWASDRLAANGIIALVTNRSFIEARTFDGFRKVMAEEFNEVRIVDLGGDVRANPKLSGTKHNVFGIQTGVAISFWIKRSGSTRRQIFYARRPEQETAGDKLAFLSSVPASELEFEQVHPDTKHNWLHLTYNNFDELMPIASKETKAAKTQEQEQAIFKLFSLGVVTSRDEWVYGINAATVLRKVKYLIHIYNADCRKLSKKGQAIDADNLDLSIKWSRAVKQNLEKGIKYTLDPSLIVTSEYRPFTRRILYYSPQLNEMQNLQQQLFPIGAANIAIMISGTSAAKPFQTLAVKTVPGLDMLEKTQTLTRYRFTKDGQRYDNITDWSLTQFQTRYSDPTITKDAIFNYVYAVLHDPLYRDQYAQNLKRDFPHIPLYDDFWQWATWGNELIQLHTNYEQVPPSALQRINISTELNPKCILMADPTAGRIIIDSATTLTSVPKTAWDYTLGNRSSIDWVLDQYKEKTPKDPTIREKFNTYRFKDYKNQVIDLLLRVTTVSVETMRIVEAMRIGSH